MLMQIAGWTYCGVGVLKFLGRLPPTNCKKRDSGIRHSVSKVNIEDLLRWLVSRQTLYLQEEDDDGLLHEDELSDLNANSTFLAFQKGDARPANSRIPQVAEVQPIELSAEELECAGFNGRCNKVADTCYAFWVGASLAVWLLSIVLSTHLKLIMSADASRSPPTGLRRHTEVSIAEDSTCDRWIWEAVWRPSW